MSPGVWVGGRPGDGCVVRAEGVFWQVFGVTSA